MQIEIDGVAYEVPDIGTFDLDEDRIFYKATGLHVEDVLLRIQDGEEVGLLDNDGFLSAVAHIAYRREHPTESAEAIFRVVGRQKRLDMVVSLAQSLEEDPPEGDAAPLADGTTGQNGSSERSNEGKPSTPPSRDGSSGKPSAPSSVPQVVALGITGTGGSDMSSMFPLTGRAV